MGNILLILWQTKRLGEENDTRFSFTAGAAILCHQVTRGDDVI